MHLSHKHPIGIVERGGKILHALSSKSVAKRSDASLTPNLYQGHTHTPKEETAVPLIDGSDQSGQEKNKLSIAFSKAGIIQATPRALTALKLQLSYI